MRRQNILSQKRPAAGEEACERASFLQEIVSEERKKLDRRRYECYIVIEITIFK